MQWVGGVLQERDFKGTSIWKRPIFLLLHILYTVKSEIGFVTSLSQYVVPLKNEASPLYGIWRGLCVCEEHPL